jgi:beta-phosphoglucomutase
MALRAAVFDFDGVIVNSEPTHFRSLRDALRTGGVEITEEEYFSTLLAYDNRGAIRRSLALRDEPADEDRVESLAALMVTRFGELLPEIQLFKGVSKLVREMADEVPLAIASGARHVEIEAILQGVGLRDAFVTIVGVEDAAHTKPDPAPYLEASRRLEAHVEGLPPGNCIAFEDSLPGISSAIDAGMRVVAVSSSCPAEKLQNAHRVVDSLVGLNVEDLRGLFED